MDFAVKEMPDFKMVGIELRTTNDNGQSFREIPLFWERFFKEDVMGKIPSKTAPDKIYAVYTDYDPQEDGATMPKGYYSLILGTPVSSFEAVPLGFKKIEVPAGKYAFKDVNGAVETAVYQAWLEVWNPLFPFKRKFSSDMEIYRMGENPAFDREASLFIAVD
ncbi:MAG: effector binding domain-containing protein [Verrucomicrobia bacterium]|nr:effector binding domain-containing protein [Verrucomicrobiota bacterium]